MKSNFIDSMELELLNAVESGNQELVTQLVENGHNFNDPYIIYFIAKNKKFIILEILLDYGLNVNAAILNQATIATLLFDEFDDSFEADVGALAMLRTLDTAGADFTLCDSNGNNALTLALKANALYSAKFIINVFKEKGIVDEQLGDREVFIHNGDNIYTKNINIKKLIESLPKIPDNLVENFYYDMDPPLFNLAAEFIIHRPKHSSLCDKSEFKELVEDIDPGDRKELVPYIFQNKLSNPKYVPEEMFGKNALLQQGMSENVYGHRLYNERDVMIIEVMQGMGLDLSQYYDKVKLLREVDLTQASHEVDLTQAFREVGLIQVLCKVGLTQGRKIEDPMEYIYSQLYSTSTEPNMVDNTARISSENKAKILKLLEGHHPVEVVQDGLEVIGQKNVDLSPE